MATSNTIRVTKAMKFNAAIALLEGNEPVVVPGTDDKAGVTMDAAYLCDFFRSELALLAKKNSKKDNNGELTEEQKAREAKKELILDFLALQEEGATCSDMIKGIPALGGANTSAVSSLTSALVKEGRIKRLSPKKGRTPFVLA